MNLRVVGAGLPRTGTKSWQLALERLLGARCYHMHQVFARPEHVPVWRSAVRGEMPATWYGLFADYAAAVDWPASAFWRELSGSLPEAIVLSVREDAATWWRSADATILQVARLDAYPDNEEWFALFHDLLRTKIGENWDDPETATAAYEGTSAEVRSGLPPERLLEWRPQDGWGPLCRALGLPVPAEPLPPRQHDGGVAGGHDRRGRPRARRTMTP